MGHLEEIFHLTGKKAFVTGGAQGIGKTLALHMAKCGMDVAIVDIDQEKAEAVAHEMEDIGVKALAIKADVSSVLNNSFGFGGHNASLAITKYNG